MFCNIQKGKKCKHMPVDSNMKRWHTLRTLHITEDPISWATSAQLPTGKSMPALL